MSLSSGVTFGRSLGQGLKWASFLHLVRLTSARQTCLINLFRPCGAVDQPRLVIQSFGCPTGAAGVFTVNTISKMVST